eukprot:9656157-Alexandrium_andersonii.AAC.1
MIGLWCTGEGPGRPVLGWAPGEPAGLGLPAFGPVAGGGAPGGRLCPLGGGPAVSGMGRIVGVPRWRRPTAAGPAGRC